MNSVLNYFNISDDIHVADSFCLLLETILGPFQKSSSPRKMMYLRAFVILLSLMVRTDEDGHIK